MRREGLLDLNDALQHPGRIVAVDISTELESEADLDLGAPLEGYLEAVGTGNLLLLTGQFSCRVILECARCGEPVELPVAFDVDEQFPVEGVPSSMSSTDYARVAPEDDEDLFEGNSLVVEALLRQALLISMPMQPLCKDAGKPDCQIPDAAESHEGRAEFAGLAKLLKEDQDS